MEANNFYRFSKFNTAMEFEEEKIAKRESCEHIAPDGQRYKKNDKWYKGDVKKLFLVIYY